MAGQSRKWMVLVAALWVQAFTGTNFDFSAYSSQLKAVMDISQVQLNYLATASDLGKALGWSSGLALLYLPLPAVLLISAGLGLVAYGVQWLLITGRISLSYFPRIPGNSKWDRCTSGCPIDSKIIQVRVRNRDITMTIEGLSCILAVASCFVWLTCCQVNGFSALLFPSSRLLLRRR